METCLIAVTYGMLCWSALRLVEQNECLTLPLEAQWLSQSVGSGN